MNLDQIQIAAHVLFQNGIDTPAFGTDDYNLRTSIINTFIRKWKNTVNITWEELRDPITGLEKPLVLLSAATSVPQMRDPNYLVFSLAARLFQLSRNNTGYTINFDEAQDCLATMISYNQRQVALRLNAVDLSLRIKTYGSFGE